LLQIAKIAREKWLELGMKLGYIKIQELGEFKERKQNT
jgi:hypothetical protein